MFLNNIEFLDIKPTEKGTLIITLTPVDENGDALVFSQLTSPSFQLMRSNGAVINNRSFANSALSSLTFVLKDDDLAYFGSEDDTIRILSFQATYNSSTLGTDLPITGTHFYY